MQIIHDMLMGSLVFLGGVLATQWASLLQSSRSPFEDAVLGPLGALALAMLVIYGLVKYLSQERKEAREAVNSRLADKSATIDRLREENARLWGEVQALRDEARGLKR